MHIFVWDISKKNNSNAAVTLSKELALKYYLSEELYKFLIGILALKHIKDTDDWLCTCWSVCKKGNVCMLYYMHEDKRKPTICIIIRMFLLCMSFVNFQERNNSRGLKYEKRLEIGDHLIQNLIISLLPGQNDYNDPNESEY